MEQEFLFQSTESFKDHHFEVWLVRPSDQADSHVLDREQEAQDPLKEHQGPERQSLPSPISVHVIKFSKQKPNRQST